MAEDSIILEKGKNSLQGDVKWVLTIGTPEGWQALQCYKKKLKMFPRVKLDH